MDAKAEDWVVTPRRGKPVEVNALWYQALCLLDEWAAKEGFDVGVDLASLRETVRESFNRRFWYERGSYLFDVVDSEDGGDDASLRPNQVFAVSLPRAVLRPDRWGPVVETVRRHLLTPVGLRTLAPGHVDYKASYDGDLRARPPTTRAQCGRGSSGRSSTPGSRPSPSAATKPEPCCAGSTSTSGRPASGP